MSRPQRHWLQHEWQPPQNIADGLLAENMYFLPAAQTSTFLVIPPGLRRLQLPASRSRRFLCHPLSCVNKLNELLKSPEPEPERLSSFGGEEEWRWKWWGAR